MFNKNKFNAMLISKNVTKEDLAVYLGINLSTLYRLIKHNGNFSATQIRLMIDYFGREQVLDCLFDNELNIERGNV